MTHPAYRELRPVTTLASVLLEDNPGPMTLDGTNTWLLRAPGDGSCIVVDPGAYNWRNTQWLGRPWEQTVLYELHTGLFGGFTGVKRELPRLAALGVTAVELMPINDFPGQRNWGYDGVLPYAPDRAY